MSKAARLTAPLRLQIEVTLLCTIPVFLPVGTSGPRFYF